MTQPRRVRWPVTWTVLVVLVVLAATGCHSSGRASPSTSASTAAKVTPEQTRTQVIAALGELWGQMKPLGVRMSADGSYNQCSDMGGDVKYNAGGRIDPPAAGTKDLGALLESVLPKAGWVVDPHPTITSDNTYRRAAKDGLDLRLISYKSTSSAILDIDGPCVWLGGNGDERYTSRGSELLPLG